MEESALRSQALESQEPVLYPRLQSQSIVKQDRLNSISRLACLELPVLLKMSRASSAERRKRGSLKGHLGENMRKCVGIYLVDLSTAEEVLLFKHTEAGLIFHSHEFKHSHGNAPEPEHCQHDDQGLVVDVEELIVGVV